MPRTNRDLAPGAWSVPALREPRYSQSLERGLAILGCFTPERPVLGIADIADRLGMSRSTTHRYVITLVALGYLEQGASRKYRLGLRPSDLGRSVIDSSGYREVAHDLLEDLRGQTGLTVSLAVLNHSEIVYLDRVSGSRGEPGLLDSGLAVGSRLPAYCTAPGKLLMAFLSEDEQSELVGSLALPKRGPKAITSQAALLTELESIGKTGFAVSEEELAADVYEIAVPVSDEDGEAGAAVGLTAHKSVVPLPELVDSFGPLLTSTADEISSRLGFELEEEPQTA